MNENNNRVQSALTDTIFNNVVNSIAAIETALAPYMPGLSNEERIALPKINVDNKAFVEDAIDAMDNVSAAVFMPTFLSPAYCKNDLKMFEQLNSLLSRLTNLVDKMEGTRILAGSEAYSSALTFKKIADAAAASGVPGASEIASKLSERFKNNGPSVAKKTAEEASN